MSDLQRHQQMVDKLARFQRAYSLTPLRVAQTGGVYAEGHGYVLSCATCAEAHTVLVDAGYEHTSKGWYPRGWVHRCWLSEMTDRLAGDIATLGKIGSTMSLDGHRRLLASQVKLTEVAAELNRAKEELL